LDILGTGIYLPEMVIDSSFYDGELQRPGGKTHRQVGVAHRHVASERESASAMGAWAAVQALAASGLEAQEIDCVVSACAVMEQAIPCQAVLIHRALGLGASGIPAFDINATCLSFLVALDLVSDAIAMGRWKRVLIVSSEIASAGINPDDMTTAPLFGDGAAAVVVGPAPEGSRASVLSSRFATYSDGADLCQVRGGGTRLGARATARDLQFEMDGRSTYRLAAQHFPSFLEGLLEDAGLDREDLDCIIPHQASGEGLEHMIAALNLPSPKVVRILEDYGNQISVSLPHALHQALIGHRFEPGQVAVLLGTGAGLSLGGMIVQR
jgi:3-oxoacyl-[acyl-carrier-protein] synthase-3